MHRTTCFAHRKIIRAGAKFKVELNLSQNKTELYFGAYKEF